MVQLFLQQDLATCMATRTWSDGKEERTAESASTMGPAAAAAFSAKAAPKPTAQASRPVKFPPNRSGSAAADRG